MKSKPVRITMAALRFTTGVAMYFVRCTIASVVMVSTMIDGMINSLVSTHEKSPSWWDGFKKSAMSSIKISILSLNVVTANAVDMIVSGWKGLVEAFT